MNRESQTIEKIVVEVLRRLSALAETPPAVATTPASAPPAPPAPPTHPDALVLDARVITTATIHGRLKGIRQLVVHPRAVVTPSVRDELKKRNVRLQRQDEAVATSDSHDLTVVRFTRADDAGQAMARLPLPAEAAERLHENLPAAVACAAEVVQCTKRVAVLVTDESLAAVCLLNRSPQVRAVIAHAVADVRQAVTAIGANVLVIDPRTMTANQWSVVVQDFRKDLPRTCPSLLL